MSETIGQQIKHQWTPQGISRKQWLFVALFAIAAAIAVSLYVANSSNEVATRPATYEPPESLEDLGRQILGGKKNPPR